MNVGVILSAHENSETYRDTLESVKKYLSEDVAVLIDGFSWKQFQSEDVDLIEGFKHGKHSSPLRNMALGLMGAWERWSASADWICYLEYDCLVGSGEIRDHLNMADEREYWMLGNDLRHIEGFMPELDRLEGSSVKEMRYFLGCCLFFSKRFMSELASKDFFGRLLAYTNFYPYEFALKSNVKNKRPLPVYDPSEFIYPSLAIHYGGSIQQLASWNQLQNVWEGNSSHYPMRFRPELTEADPFQAACVMHPVKEASGPIRSFHKNKRNSG